MPISYPLSLPSTPAMPREMTLTPRSVVAVTKSPFSMQQQVVAHAAQWWEATITLPPMTRAVAEYWIAFFLRLNGMEGTFYLGDFAGATARGIATGTPKVKGASQTGYQLITDGWTISQTGILLAGDYFTLGTGTSTTLHKVTADANSDGSGDSTLDIWPDLRSSPADNADLDVTAPKGVFRLTSNDMPFDISTAQHYGISFSAIEAL